MKKYLPPITAVSLMTFMSMASCSPARGFVTTTETMTCGASQFVIESTCKKGPDNMTLNECRGQRLHVKSPAKSQTISLPHLTKHDANLIKHSGGRVSDLFVIQWGCANVKGKSTLALYYSIGGGSAPYSESWSMYDDTGKLIDDNKLLDEESNARMDKAMKPVRSIMPE